VYFAILDDDRLIEDALGAAKLLSDELIAADTQLDVIGGSAGAILSFSVYTVTPRPTKCWSAQSHAAHICWLNNATDPRASKLGVPLVEWSGSEWDVARGSRIRLRACRTGDHDGTPRVRRCGGGMPRFRAIEL
jgi:hypothetical protein